MKFAILENLDQNGAPPEPENLTESTPVPSEKSEPEPEKKIS